MHRKLYYHSPIGIWRATWKNAVLVRFELVSSKSEQFPELAETQLAATQLPVAQLLETQLQQFFTGTLQKFSVPYVLTGTTFQLAVWHALKRIPFGETTTYGALAEQIGHPRAVRAVGTAVGKNPLPLLIGCHRVLGKNSLGGYAYGLKLKEHLLNLEQKN